MNALAHLDPATQQLLGVWVWDGKQPQSYYEAAPSDVQRGQAAMASRTGSSWPDWVARLGDRSLSESWWEPLEVPEGETASALFARLKAE